MNIRRQGTIYPANCLHRYAMVLWVGVDDTDSRLGMCTTFLATELVHSLTREWDIIGYPRLVRLNPNVPWKTRGNGAVCLRIGKGRGTPIPVGWIRGETVLAHPRGDDGIDSAEVADRVATEVERWSAFEDPTTNPAFVVLRERPSPSLYWKAVRDIVEINEAAEATRGRGVVRTYKNGRGLVGAAAATAWRPRDRTYEVLAYRFRERWGHRRTIDPRSVVMMDQEFGSTFNSYDYERCRPVIAPRSPCPVLLGIRGDDPCVLPEALSRIRGEPPERWLVFETNQGTDDHVVPWPPRPRTTVRIHGAVTQPPRTLRGRHVVFGLNEFEATAYEPSKGFRRVVRQLVPGDFVEVIGAVRDSPRTVNIEKVYVESLTTCVRKAGNPMCLTCGKRAKSMGRGAGFRCARCRRLFPASAAAFARLPRNISPGWYEPPVGSRRHLSKPLKRMRDARIGSSSSSSPHADEERRALSPTARIVG